MHCSPCKKSTVVVVLENYAVNHIYLTVGVLDVVTAEGTDGLVVETIALLVTRQEHLAREYCRIESIAVYYCHCGTTPPKKKTVQYSVQSVALI